MRAALNGAKGDITKSHGRVEVSTSREIDVKELELHNTKDDAWIAIRGKVYDVTEFGKLHPGGHVIYTYAGRDATDPFSVFHAKQSWNQLPLYQIGKLVGEEISPLEKDFRAMRTQMQREGLFKSSKPFYVYKVLSTFSILLAGIALLSLYGATSLVGFQAAALVFGLFLQQSGWLAHDFCHNQVFEDRRWNFRAGLVVGNLWQGFSISWWNDKHNTHHAACNWIDEHHNAVDPDIDTIPLLAWSQDMLHQAEGHPFYKTLIRIQPYTIAPLLSVARFSWLNESVKFMWSPNMKKDRVVAESSLIALHYACFFSIIFSFLGPLAAFGFFMMSQVYAGIFLSLVFVQSHNGMEILSDEQDWIRGQVLTTRNIAGDLFTDWFTGGLNKQIEHHLFPTMPRHSFKRARELVMDLCEKHGIAYEECNMFTGTYRVVSQLAKVAKKVE